MHLHLLLLPLIAIILGDTGDARAVLVSPSMASTNNDLAETPRILGRRDDGPYPGDRYEMARRIRAIEAALKPGFARASKTIDAAQESLKSSPDLPPEEAKAIRLRAFNDYAKVALDVFRATGELNPWLAHMTQTGLLDANLRWPEILHEPL
jgi:hypothetical protein